MENKFVTIITSLQMKINEIIQLMKVIIHINLSLLKLNIRHHKKEVILVIVFSLMIIMNVWLINY